MATELKFSVDSYAMLTTFQTAIAININPVALNLKAVHMAA